MPKPAGAVVAWRGSTRSLVTMITRALKGQLDGGHCTSAGDSSGTKSWKRDAFACVCVSVPVCVRVCVSVCARARKESAARRGRISSPSLAILLCFASSLALCAPLSTLRSKEGVGVCVCVCVSLLDRERRRQPRLQSRHSFSPLFSLPLPLALLHKRTQRRKRERALYG